MATLDDSDHLICYVDMHLYLITVGRVASEMDAMKPRSGSHVTCYITLPVMDTDDW